MGWAQAVPRFLNLTLVGVMLGLAYQRTGNLWFSIGMHAGWILWVKVYHLLTQPVWGSCKWFWGTVHVVDGWLATPVLILVSILITQSPLVGQIDPVHDQGFDGVRNSQ
jgi:membrane protease YdiL (CAAX protease family)